MELAAELAAAREALPRVEPEAAASDASGGPSGRGASEDVAAALRVLGLERMPSSKVRRWLPRALLMTPWVATPRCLHPTRPHTLDAENVYVSRRHSRPGVGVFSMQAPHPHATSTLRRASTQGGGQRRRPPPPPSLAPRRIVGRRRRIYHAFCARGEGLSTGARL